jgi:penicillin-insensitive murein DD-endopeptidase
VRMGCPAGSQTCEHQVPVNSADDGCGKELDDWIKLVSAPPKPAPVPAPKPVPPVPKPEMNLEQLPVDCRAVITAGEPKDSPAVKAVAEIKLFHEQEKAEKAAKVALAKAAAAAKLAEKTAEKTAKSAASAAAKP